MSEKPAEAKPIEWGAVQALAMVVGVREAARRMQLSEEQVKKRCTREGWLKSPEARAINKMVVAERSCTTRPQTSPSNPAALILSEIVALGQQSRLSLAKAVQRGSAHAAELSGPEILEQSGNVKSIAQTADLVHGWKDSAPQVKLRLDILGSAAAPDSAIEIEADVTEIPNVSDSDSWDNELDSY